MSPFTNADAGQSFGPLIARRRLELGLSQRELADRICAVTGRPTFTRHELSRYERGVRRPNEISLAALAAALEMPLANLAIAAGKVKIQRGSHDDRLRHQGPTEPLRFDWRQH